MKQLILKTFFAFFLVLESFIIADLMFKLLPKTPANVKSAAAFNQKLEPILRPARYIIRHSSFYNVFYDLSPYVTIMVLIFIQKLLLM